MGGRERWRERRCSRRGRVLAAASLLAISAVLPVSSRGASAAIPGAQLTGGIGIQLTAARVMPALTGSGNEISVQSSIGNSFDRPIEIDTGCGTAPALLLRSTTGMAYRAVPILPGAGETCHSQSTILQPGSSLPALYAYALRGYAGAPYSAGVSFNAGNASVRYAAPTAIPGGLYDLQLVVTYRVVTGDAAQRYRTLPDGHLVDTWPAHWSGSNLAPLSLGPDGPATRGTASAGDAGPFRPKVLVIDYNTSGTANDGATALTSQLASALSTATRYHGAATGSAQFQLYGIYTENNPPPIVAGTGKGDGTGRGDYAAIFAKYGICALATTQGVNFVWIWAAGTEAGGPFYAGDFFEWVTTGPTFNETYGSNVPNCGHTVVTMGLNYSRDVALAVHSHGHYMENVLGYSFGPADHSGPGGTDMYDLFDGQVYRYNGVNPPLSTTAARCGDVHYPPNTTQAYDYGNTNAVLSECATYNPGRPGLAQYTPVSASTWEAVGCDPSIADNKGDCDQESYLLWWMQNMPGAGNSAVDCAQSPMPNWWQYIVALDTVTTATANACGQIAGVTASQPSGPAEGTVIVTASGFSSGESVSLYWDSLASAPSMTASASGGAVTATMTVPATTAGPHTIFVKGAISGVLGSVPYTVETSGAPGVPGKAVMTSAGPGMGSATLTWLAASDGGSALTGYTAACSPPVGSGKPSGSTSVDGSTLTAVVSGLTSGTPYTCTVSATNANGTTASDPAGVTPGTAQPIADAGFETGLSPWIATSAQGHSLLDTTGGRSGNASVRLCGSNACSDTLTQTVTLPADPLSARLTFWLSARTQEKTSACYDTLTVQLRSAAGAALQSFPAICQSTTTGWVQKVLAVSPALLAAHAGGPIQVFIRGATNAVNPTAFVLDDLALTITTSAGAPDLLANGDFENGLTSWFSSSSQGHTLLSTAAAHSPAHSVHLCGSNGCTDAVWQTVVLPPGSLTGTLSYWVDIATQERTTVCYDSLTVQLRTASGIVFQTTPPVCQSNTGGWVRKTVSLSGTALSAHAGQPIQVSFRATTNRTNPTDYYLDDVVMSVSAQ